MKRMIFVVLLAGVALQSPAEQKPTTKPQAQFSEESRKAIRDQNKKLADSISELKIELDALNLELVKKTLAGLGHPFDSYDVEMQNMLVERASNNQTKTLLETARKTIKAAIDSGETASDFTFSDLSIGDGDHGVQKVMFEVTNKSGKDYAVARFKISLYDAEGKLVGTADAIAMPLKNGSEKTTDALVDQSAVRRMKRYKIQFDGGV